MEDDNDDARHDEARMLLVAGNALQFIMEAAHAADTCGKCTMIMVLEMIAGGIIEATPEEDRDSARENLFHAMGAAMGVEMVVQRAHIPTNTPAGRRGMH